MNQLSPVGSVIAPNMYPVGPVYNSSNVTVAGVNVTVTQWEGQEDLVPPHPLHSNRSRCGHQLLTDSDDVISTQKVDSGCWTTPPPPVMTPTEVTLLATVLVMVFAASLVANAFVCVVFSKRRSSLSISNRFLANLTLCNCLFTLLVMPPAFVSLVTRSWPFGPVLCQCTGLAMNLLVSASIFTLVVISFDRPFESDRYYTLFLVSLSFVLPLVAMLWTYSCIFRAARDNSERTRRSSIVPTVHSDPESGSQSTPINKRRRSSSVPIIRRLSQTSSRSSSLIQRREEWKTAVTSFLVLFSFMLCWLPYFIVICIRSVAPDLQLHPVMATISTAAAMFGCACNPMVYVFRSKGTRQDLKVILTRRRSFRHESIHSSIRRGGSMRSTCPESVSQADTSQSTVTLSQADTVTSNSSVTSNDEHY
nr:hypothetical protein BaRGS_022902 [Batillaria attramentaria]